MTKEVKLALDRQSTVMVGFEQGKEVFNKQVRSIIKNNDKITIVIPSRIERVSISFVLGFISDLPENYPLDNLIFTGNKNVVDKINDVKYF